MPVGVSQWRTGIAHLNSVFHLVTLPRVLLFDLFTFKRLLFVMYCYFAAVLFFASLIPRVTISSGVIPAQGRKSNFFLGGCTFEGPSFHKRA